MAMTELNVYIFTLFTIHRPGSIFFSLTAAVISIDITITQKGIILNSFQGGTSSLLQDTSDKIMSFDELKHLLFRAGVNLFPDEDAFCYCDGECTNSMKLFELKFNILTCHLSR